MKGLWFSLAVLLFSSPIGADSGASEEYRISPGDELEIRIFEHEDLTLSFIAPYEGSINFPPIGKVRVTGKTLSELEEGIRTGLEQARYIVQPQVSVLVKKYFPSRKVYVVRGVKEPGAKDLPFDKMLRLQQVISLAGGLLEDSDIENVMIFRYRRDPDDLLEKNEREPAERYLIRINLRDIVERGLIDRDIIIKPGDTIYIDSLNKKDKQIFVSGRVKSPGAYPFDSNEGITVTQALVKAGWFDQFASPRNILISRKEKGKTKVFTVNIYEVLQSPKGDIPLKPNDIIFVPESFF